MAPRVLLLSILFTVGLLTGRSIAAAGLELSLGFALQPQDVVAVRSKPLTLLCAASSTLPGPTNITWTHNRQPVALGDPRRFQQENGSLYFKKVLYKRAGPHESSDEGEYRCIIRNSVGALISQPAQLSVAVLSHDFDKFPTDTTAEEGDVVRFTCQIKSVPRALITWERNGNPLPQTSRTIMLDSIDQDSGDLYLTDVKMADEGTYRCIAINELTKKNRSSTEGILTVRPSEDFLIPPSFLNPLPASLHGKLGDSLNLPCAVQRIKKPEITWTFVANGSNETQTVANQQAGGLNVLRLHNLTQGHAGNYTCTVKGPDVDIPPQRVRLDVWMPPTIKEKPTSQVYPTAKTVRFKCEAVGLPHPKVTWYKDGEELQINGRIKQRELELVISNAVTSDSGLYQCVVSSKAGEVWAAGRLHVNSSRFQPEPPHSLICQSLTSSQMRLEWEEPLRLAEGKIMAYTVHYFLTDGGEERQEVSVNRSFLVEKLTPFTNYTFYVRAYSERSASDQSPRIICQTGEGVPQEVPDITLDATSPTTVRVAWTPLPSDKARGIITEYKIQWRRFGQPSSNVEEVKGDVLEYTVTGLHPGKKYDIRVLAATKRGWPDLPEEHLLWKTLEMPSYGQQNVPLPPVVNLSVINSSSIDVIWSMPDENKFPPLGFKLFYRKQTGQLLGPVELPANSTHYALGDLEPHTWYEVHVLGFNSDGTGGLGFQAIHTLPTVGVVGLLEPPGNLEAAPTSPTSISLSWTPPPGQQGPVTHYNVSYRPVARGPNGSLSYARGQGFGVVISNLRPYTLYEFKVRTHDRGNRHGPYSLKLECHTMEDVPSVVQDVQWKPMNSSSVRITWKEPIQANGVIVSYLVAFTPDVGQPREHWSKVSVAGTKTNADVMNLTPKTRYFLSVQAATHAGFGPPTENLIFKTPASVGEPVLPEAPPTQDTKSDQHLGILVGVAIGMACIVVCIGALVWRRRYIRGGAPGGDGTGIGAQHANGNGYYRDAELHELDYCVPAATNIPPVNHSLLDTKGGYPNGHANGLNHPLLSNGRIPNGQSTRDRSSVHITENPQYNCGDSLSEPLQANEQLEGEDGGSPVDHRAPLLGDTHDCNVISEPECEGVMESSSLNCTQLTQLETSAASNITGTSSGQQD